MPKPNYIALTHPHDFTSCIYCTVHSMLTISNYVHSPPLNTSQSHTTFTPILYDMSPNLTNSPPTSLHNLNLTTLHIQYPQSHNSYCKLNLTTLHNHTLPNLTLRNTISHPITPNLPTEHTPISHSANNITLHNTQSPCWALGWSDFHFFSILKNGHIAIDVLYFYYYELICKKSAIFASRTAKFSFSKNHRDLENEYFF